MAFRTATGQHGKAPIIKKTFLHNKKTDKRFRLNGDKESSRKPSKDSLHKDFSQYVAYSAPQLPQKVDLRPWMTQIEDQSDTNSCTANAMAGIYEYLNYRITGSPDDVSRLFIYYNSRVRDGEPDITDEGTTITSTIEAVAESGVCPEYMWPYNIKKVNIEPNRQCYDVAVQYSIAEALEVDVDLNEMKSCLAQGFPILSSINVYNSFYNAEEHGIVPMPKRNEGSPSTHGRHAVVLAGYSDKSQAFIVRNSWGYTWGDKGYCYIPYGYIGSTELCNSAWAVKKLGMVNLGTEGWTDEDDQDYLEDDDEDDGDDDDDDGEIEEVEEEDEPDEDDDEDDDE